MATFFRKIILGKLAVSLVIALPVIASAQRSLPEPIKIQPLPVIVEPQPLGDFERSIAVDKKVNTSLCITEGNVHVNGWNRDEIRVLVRGGSKFSFEVKTTGDSKLPALIWVVGSSSKRKYAPVNECIWGENIEIDVPVASSINIKGKSVTAVIDSVRKSRVEIVGGDIQFRNISEGVTATTGQGDLSVESSSGPMMLNTTTGNIVVFDSKPYEVGDLFKAKTNGGNLSLQQIGFRQVEVNSITGSVLFNGDVIKGANYSIETTQGSIRLQVPPATSCMISAVYSAGSFTYDLPFKVITENISEGSVKRIVGKLGMGGDTQFKLSTTAGTISVKKQ